jgi:hypothetical protein
MVCCGFLSPHLKIKKPDQFATVVRKFSADTGLSTESVVRLLCLAVEEKNLRDTFTTYVASVIKSLTPDEPANESGADFCFTLSREELNEATCLANLADKPEGFIPLRKQVTHAKKPTLICYLDLVLTDDGLKFDIYVMAGRRAFAGVPPHEDLRNSYSMSSAEGDITVSVNVVE